MTMMQKTLSMIGIEYKPNHCKFCGKDYQIYGGNNLCIDCEIGIHNGQWVWDKIAERW